MSIIAVTLRQWIEAINANPELTFSDAALFNGGCLTEDLETGAAEIERLRAAGDAAFLAMCAYRGSKDDEVFQDAIDALGAALAGEEDR